MTYKRLLFYHFGDLHLGCPRKILHNLQNYYFGFLFLRAEVILDSLGLSFFLSRRDGALTLIFSVRLRPLSSASSFRLFTSTSCAELPSSIRPRNFLCLIFFDLAFFGIGVAAEIKVSIFSVASSGISGLDGSPVSRSTSSFANPILPLEAGREVVFIFARLELDVPGLELKVPGRLLSREDGDLTPLRRFFVSFRFIFIGFGGIRWSTFTEDESNLSDCLIPSSLGDLIVISTGGDVDSGLPGSGTGELLIFEDWSSLGAFRGFVDAEVRGYAKPSRFLLSPDG